MTANSVFASKLIGQRVATVYNGSAPGANTAILATGLVPDWNVAAYRVTVALSTATVLNVTVTDGTTEFIMGLNESTALQALDLYTFVFGVSANKEGSLRDETGTALTYNFEVETDSVISYLIVDEIVGPVL